MRGWTRNANRINTQEYRHKVGVILHEIILSSFFKSAMAASGKPQFATGPQKCVEKKYSRAAGERNHATNALDMVYAVN